MTDKVMTLDWVRGMLSGSLVQREPITPNEVADCVEAIDAHITQHAEGKKQWDQVAALLGADGDNVDQVLAKATQHTALIGKLRELSHQMQFASTGEMPWDFCDGLNEILDAQPASERASDPMAELVAQAQALDMGYGKPASEPAQVDVATIRKVTVDIRTWDDHGDRPDEWILRDWHTALAEAIGDKS
jgi:hypothetical protein